MDKADGKAVARPTRVAATEASKRAARTALAAVAVALLFLLLAALAQPDFSQHGPGQCGGQEKDGGESRQGEGAREEVDCPRWHSVKIFAEQPDKFTSGH